MIRFSEYPHLAAMEAINLITFHLVVVLIHQCILVSANFSYDNLCNLTPQHNKYTYISAKYVIYSSELLNSKP